MKMSLTCLLNMFSSSRSICWTSISRVAGGRVTGDVCLCSAMLVLKQSESMLLLYLMIGCIDNGPKMGNFKIERWYIP